MSAQPWSARLGINSLESLDFFLAVDVSGVSDENKKVTADQIVDFIEANLTSLNNTLNIRGNNLINVGSFQGLSTAPNISLRSHDNNEILDLRAVSTPTQFIQIQSTDTGTGPLLTTDGTPGNIVLVIDPKGSGKTRFRTDAQTEKLIVDQRLKLNQSDSIQAELNLTLGDGNLFPITGPNIILARLSTVGWPDGSIVVLNLLDSTDVEDNFAGNSGDFVHFQLRSNNPQKFTGPGTLTLFLGTDASTATTAWIEISRVSL